MPEPAHAEAADQTQRRVLVVRAGNARHALPAERVREVVRPFPLARVPLAPEALLGLGNLRGAVLPVAGLARLLGVPAGSEAERARIVVLEGRTSFGLLVDDVVALTLVPEAGIHAPDGGLTEASGIVSGVFRLDGGADPVQLLDIDGLVAAASGPPREGERAELASARKLGTGDLYEDTRLALLVFAAEGQEFGLPLASIVEVREREIDFVNHPSADGAILGMIALRDGLTPLVSLAALMGLGARANGAGTIVVVLIGGTTVALAVDAVRDIARVEPDELEPVPPLIAARARGEAKVQSVVKLEGGTRLVSILSLDHMFGEDVMKRVGRAAHTDAAGEAAVEERTFLVFTLAGQAYGLAIQSVEEVARMPETVTRLPHAPAFLRGVINLRGVVLPIVDQRQRLNLSDDGADGEGRLIVVKTRAGLAGLAVDTVQEVLRAPVSAISPPPASASGAGMVEGVLNLAASSQMILLLDPAALLNNTETGLLDALGSVNEAPPSVDQSARS